MSAPTTRVLVVEDEPSMRLVLEERLRQWGFEVRGAAGGESGRQLAESFDPDVVISDVVLPEVSGLELLRILKAGSPARVMILITAQGTVDMAVEAMKQGAHDFLTKPLDYSKLRAVLDASLAELASRRESQRLTAQLERNAGFGRLVGTSRRMREVYAQLTSIASKNVPAIITGETGAGKDLAALTIHERSDRCPGPFVAVNAAAIPKDLIESEIFGHEKGAFTGAISARPGCFELAEGGTLFLDEIAEMPPALQPRLLRILEEGRVRRLGSGQEIPLDVRVLAATNQNPVTAVEQGRLRRDLYFRLNVFTVTLPALRDRRDDIPALVQHFIAKANEKHGAAVQAVRPEVWERLKEYSWPGNVRELKNALERAVIVAQGDWIELSHLPPYLRHAAPPAEEAIVLPAGVTAAETEKQLILKTLEQTGNNKAAAARRLGLDVKTIRNKLKAYGIH